MSETKKVKETVKSVAGKAKETVGTGATKADGQKMQAEAKTDYKAQQAQQKTEGILQSTIGTIKDTIGGLLGQTQTQAEGKVDKTKGHVITAFEGRNEKELSIAVGDIVYKLSDTSDPRLCYVRKRLGFKDYRVRSRGLVPIQNIVFDESPPMIQPPPVPTRKSSRDCTAADLPWATLRKPVWVDGNTIQHYIMLVRERAKEMGLAVYALSTYFYTRYQKEGYDSISKWTRKVDLFAMHYLLVPINQHSHWTLVIIDMRRKTITFYDSCMNDGTVQMTLILAYLCQEHYARKGTALIEGQWQLKHAADFTPQDNSYDCGVYICKFARNLLRRDWDRLTMLSIRRYMLEELTQKKLIFN